MKSTIRTNIEIIILTLAIAAIIPCVRTSASSRFKSQGKIVFTNGTFTTRDDVIFDATDFEGLAIVCK